MARIVKRYRLVATVTICAVVFLILVGGIVRSTGSGMGCPDWPTCFGKIIPPTHVSQLPENYQEIYKDHGYGSTEFNPVKTWIEYINRLIGVLIGLLAIGTVAASIPLRKANNNVFILSALALLLIIIQGGIGAVVVRTNLKVGMISIHMLVAIICLMVLIMALIQSYRPMLEERKKSLNLKVDRRWWMLGIISLSLVFIQILLGTQVREMVDTVALALGEEKRGEWVNSLGTIYTIHRSSYYVVVLSIVLWAYQSRKFFDEMRLFKWLMVGMVFLVGAEVIMGISMHHFAIPPFIQPFHLLFAILLFAVAFSGLCIMFMLTKKQAMRVNESLLENA